MTTRGAAFIATVAMLGVAAILQGTGRLSGHGFGFGRSDGCTLEQVPGEAGAARVLADCDWDVSATHLDALIRDWDAHERYFDNLAESTVLSDEGTRARVRQVHTASGISEREVVVDWYVEAVPNGHRYRWEKSVDQTGASGSRVEVERTTGFWEVTSRPAGVRLRYSVEYLPGGNVPAFLIRMFQSSGMRGVLADLRDAAERTQVASADRPAAD